MLKDRKDDAEWAALVGERAYHKMRTGHYARTRAGLASLVLLPATVAASWITGSPTIFGILIFCDLGVMVPVFIWGSVQMNSALRHIQKQYALPRSSTKDVTSTLTNIAGLKKYLRAHGKIEN